MTWIWVSLAVEYWVAGTLSPPMTTLVTSDGYMPVPVIVKLSPGFTDAGLTLETTGCCSLKVSPNGRGIAEVSSAGGIGKRSGLGASNNVVPVDWNSSEVCPL